MPSGNTFDVRPIGALVKKYLAQSTLSVDPFARDKEWATLTNDLNPATKAQFHLDAYDFLCTIRDREPKQYPDLFIFDPPYSPRQIKELYDGIGLKMKREDAWRTAGWKKEKDAIDDMIYQNGIVISCDWNSMGMGIKRGYEFVEGLLVCHGAGHNDTIVTVERKDRTIAKQVGMF